MPRKTVSNVRRRGRKEDECLEKKGYVHRKRNISTCQGDKSYDKRRDKSAVGSQILRQILWENLEKSTNRVRGKGEQFARDSGELSR